MSCQPISLREVHTLVVHHGVSAADAAARYYAGRSDYDLARALQECSRTTAFWEEHNRPDQVQVQRVRLGAIAAETERRQLAASRGEVGA